MEKNKDLKALKKEEDEEEKIRRKQYIEDRDNMKIKYYKNLNIK